MCVSFLVLPTLYNQDEESEISRKMEGTSYLCVCIYIYVSVCNMTYLYIQGMHERRSRHRSTTIQIQRVANIKIMGS